MNTRTRTSSNTSALKGLWRMCSKPNEGAVLPALALALLPDGWFAEINKNVLSYFFFPLEEIAAATLNKLLHRNWCSGSLGCLGWVFYRNEQPLSLLTSANPALRWCDGIYPTFERPALTLSLSSMPISIWCPLIFRGWRGQGSQRCSQTLSCMTSSGSWASGSRLSSGISRVSRDDLLFFPFFFLWGVHCQGSNPVLLHACT